LNYSFNLDDKNNYNEFIKTCNVDNIKCRNLFQKGLNEVLPVCYSAKNYKQYDVLDKIEKLVKEYQENCKENVSEEIQVKVVEDCNKEIPDESLFYFDVSSEEDFNKTCSVFQSEEYEKYKSIIEYIPICNLAFMLTGGDVDSYENELVYTNYNLLLIFLDGLSYCNDGYDIYLLKKCADTLDRTYYECVIDEIPTNDEEFYYQCIFFTQDKCQNFYREPHSEECSIVQEKNEIFLLSPSHPKWQEYNDKCFDLVESKRVTKPVQPTSIKSVETISTKSKSVKTTTTKIKSVKKTTTKSKLVKTTFRHQFKKISTNRL